MTRGIGGGLKRWRVDRGKAVRDRMCLHPNVELERLMPRHTQVTINTRQV